MPDIALTWVGGPTAVLEYAGLRILTDPTFDAPGEYSAPGTTTLVKTHGPGVALAELGPVDLVLLSHHAHKDNLDRAGLAVVAGAGTTLSTTLAASELDIAAVVGLEPWRSWANGEVVVTAVPALHGLPGSEPHVGPAIGFVLESSGLPGLYVSGDNASLSLVEEIAARFPGIEVAVLFAGAARVPGIDAALTLTSAQARQAAEILDARAVVVLHTADWAHFTEGPDTVAAAFEGSDRLVAAPRGGRVLL